MYWNSNPVTSIHLESLLNKENVTLQEIMDDEGVLQECKSQNTHLIEYLIRADVLEKLVCLTTEEPPGSDEDTIKYKYSNIACELLTSEVPLLSESLANNEALLRKLYSFLDSDAPLNPLLASFFSKTLSVLITRNSEQNWYSYKFTCLKVLEFLKLKENSITLLLKHLGTSAIMDLVFKLITKVEDDDMKDNTLNWLDEQKLVENLVGLLDPSVNSDLHYNAAQLLCDVIRTSRTKRLEISQQNKILDRIESPETVSLLLDVILKEPKCETSIVGGISVLLTLLEDKCSDNVGSTQYSPDYLKVVASTTKAILPRLKDFHDILINPPLKPPVKTTITVLEPPLGNTRVEVAKLLSVLVASNNEEINKELAELDTINVLLDLFFKYTWNNFLHTQVQRCLVIALTSDAVFSENGEIQNGLIAHIFSKCRLIHRILDAWQDNETQQTEHKRPRRGYMGHLIKIASTILSQSRIHSFGALMKETVDNETLNKWENFVNTKLAKIYDIYYRTCLGEGNSSSNDKEADVKEGSFGNFSQQLYSNYYQLQALAPAFTGGFGSFQEDQFNDDEDMLSTSAYPNFQKVNFNLNDADTDQQAVFFEKVCAQKFQTLDDYDEYVWNPDSTSPKPNEKDWQAMESSSSDEEEMESLKKSLNLHKEDAQDYNALAGWPDESEVPPAESLNPWESSGNADASPDLGWANFESASFVADFGLNLASDINTTIATSASYDIDTMPMDLTPNENINIGELFSKEGKKQEEEKKKKEKEEEEKKLKREKKKEKKEKKEEKRDRKEEEEKKELKEEKKELKGEKKELKEEEKKELKEEEKKELKEVEKKELKEVEKKELKEVEKKELKEEEKKELKEEEKKELKEEEKKELKEEEKKELKEEEKKELKEEELEEGMEKPQVVENNPITVVYTDVEIITKAVEKMTLEGERREAKPSNEAFADTDKEKTKTGSEPAAEASEKDESQEVQVNCVEKPEVIGDVNNVVIVNEQKESSENFRFLSSQGLMTNSEREPESGDSYQLLKENVQAVPNETAQTSSEEVGSSSSEDKSPNGPI